MPTFRDLRAYLERDGWTEIPSLVRGRRRRGDHRRYRKELPDGTILRTKVSHDLDAEIGKDLFRHILRQQLRTDVEHFRDVVRGRAKATVDQPRPAIAPIPGWLVVRLIHTVGLPEERVRERTADEALAAWEEFRTRSG